MTNIHTSSIFNYINYILADKSFDGNYHTFSFRRLLDLYYLIENKIAMMNISYFFSLPKYYEYDAISLIRYY